MSEPKPNRIAPVAPQKATQAKFLQIRDYRKTQHYRERRPPWVKLHGELLEDYEFQQLPDATKFHAIALTWLASRTENKIPNDPQWVASKIGAHEPVNLEALVRFKFLEPWQPRLTEPAQGEQMPLPPAEMADESAGGTTASDGASKMLAERYQPASPETEAEAETHTEADTTAASAGPVCVCCGLRVFSKYTFADALKLTREWQRVGKLVKGQPVQNPGGLARKLHIEGTADTEIEEFLYPPPPPARRQFTDQKCKACFGSKMETVDGPQGRAARPCTRCVDEQGRRTGLEPADGG